MVQRQTDASAQRLANRRIATVVFFISLLILGIFLAILIHFRSSLREQELRYLASNTANKVQKAISDRMWKAETLATLIKEGEGTINDFEKTAAILVDDPTILNVTLAPDGVVDRVYPLQGNESVIGLDYLGSGGRDEARAAVETGQLTLAGPFRLIQGGEAVTGRLPVFFEQPGGRGKTFWGFVGIALRYPLVLDAAHLDEAYQHGFVGQLWRTNPENGQKQIIWQSGDQLLASPETREIHLFNVEWHITVARVHDPLASFAPLGYSAGIILFCLLISILVYHYLELRNAKAALEHMAMTDALTSLPNRRAIMSRLSRTITLTKAHQGFFALVYLDLDGFKQVNDTFSHEAGDRVLVETAAKLRECVGDRGVVARVGGDEFIILLPRAKQGAALEEFLGDLRRCLRRTIREDGNQAGAEVEIAASFGTAFFPDDGQEIGKLLHSADVRMFEAKRQSHIKHRDFISHFRD